MITRTKLFSPQLGRDMTLRIYTPPDYDAAEAARYPVGYFFDGQNLFDPKTSSYGMIWAADQALEQLDLPMILVGLDSSPDDRLAEYAPWPFGPDVREEFRHDKGAKGALTARFVVEDVIPRVEQAYRVNGRRMIAGSSLGGVMSLYTAITYPKQFDWVLAMSTAAWVFQEDMEQCLKKIDGRHKQRFYLDTGTDESKEENFDTLYLESNRRLAHSLSQTGASYKFYIEAGGRHNENAWRRRLPKALDWLINDRWEES